MLCPERRVLRLPGQEHRDAATAAHGLAVVAPENLLHPGVARKNHTDQNHSDVLALGSDLRQALGQEGVHGHGAQILALAGTDGNGAVLHIPVAHHQHIGDLLHLGFPDLVADLLAAAVQSSARMPASIQLLGQALGVLVRHGR